MNADKNPSAAGAVVTILMGSKNDLPVMRVAAEILRDFDLPWEAHVISAHRAPDLLADYVEKLAGRGKVRDLYAVGDDKLLMVQTDRISAFDVVLEDAIPGKGEVLTAMTRFWLGVLPTPNHLCDDKPEDVVDASDSPRLPAEIITATAARYREIRQRLTAQG